MFTIDFYRKEAAEMISILLTFIFMQLTFTDSSKIKRLRFSALYCYVACFTYISEEQGKRVYNKIPTSSTQKVRFWRRCVYKLQRHNNFFFGKLLRWRSKENLKILRVRVYVVCCIGRTRSEWPFMEMLSATKANIAYFCFWLLAWQVVSSTSGPVVNAIPPTV